MMVSTTLRCISLTPSWRLVGRPRLIIACRRRAMPSGQGAARWSIGKPGAGQIGKMLLLPFITGCIGFRRLGQRAIHPAIPLGPHPDRLDLARIDDPAPLALSPLNRS